MMQIARRLFERLLAARSNPLWQGLQELREEINRLNKANTSMNRMIQLQVLQLYKTQISQGITPDFTEIGFDVFSPTHEDGILLFIFSAIGMRNRQCIDIGSAGVEDSTVSNLIINHAFQGLLIDGNMAAIDAAQKYYRSHPATKLFPPKLINEFITAENINSIISDNGFNGEIDLLSIDIDGNDYWIWKAIDIITPRVVVVEYQDILGPERSWTIPYQPDFTRDKHEVNKTHMNYGGASLRAFTNLAHSKGYRLVGCNRGGWNAFFIADSIISNTLPEVTVESCFRYPWNLYGMRERFPLIKDLPWQEV